jgi:hypothetical protein
MKFNYSHQQIIMSRYLNKKSDLIYKDKIKLDKFYQQISLELKIWKKYMKNGINLIIINKNKWLNRN